MHKGLLLLQGALLFSGPLVLRSIAVAVRGYGDSFLLAILPLWFGLFGIIFGALGGWKYGALWTPGLVSLASMAGLFLVWAVWGDIGGPGFEILLVLTLAAAFLVAFVPSLLGWLLKRIHQGKATRRHWFLLALCLAFCIAMLYFMHQ